MTCKNKNSLVSYTPDNWDDTLKHDVADDYFKYTNVFELKIKTFVPEVIAFYLVSWNTEVNITNTVDLSL